MRFGWGNRSETIATPKGRGLLPTGTSGVCNEGSDTEEEAVWTKTTGIKNKL